MKNLTKKGRMKITNLFIATMFMMSPCFAQVVLSLDHAKLQAIASLKIIDQMGSSRLHALLKNPERIRELDQRRFLPDKNAVERVLAQTLTLPKLLFPDIFDSLAASNSITSICLTDGTLFIWKTLGDIDAVAMMPLKGTDHQRGDAQTINVWLCATSELAANDWSRQPNDEEFNGWIETHLENLTGATLHLSGDSKHEDGLRKMQGVLKADQVDRQFTIRVGQKIIGIEISLSSDELSNARPTAQDSESKKHPKVPILVPVDWPPKEH